MGAHTDLERAVDLISRGDAAACGVCEELARGDPDDPACRFLSVAAGARSREQADRDPWWAALTGSQARHVLEHVMRVLPPSAAEPYPLAAHLGELAVRSLACDAQVPQGERRSYCAAISEKFRPVASHAMRVFEDPSVPRQWAEVMLNAALVERSAGRGESYRNLMAAAVVLEPWLGVFALIVESEDRVGLARAVLDLARQRHDGAAALAGFLATMILDGPVSIPTSCGDAPVASQDAQLQEVLQVIGALEDQRGLAVRTGLAQDPMLLEACERARAVRSSTRWFQPEALQLVVECCALHLLSPDSPFAGEIERAARDRSAGLENRGVAVSLEQITSAIEVGASLLEVYARLAAVPAGFVFDVGEDRSSRVLASLLGVAVGLQAMAAPVTARAQAPQPGVIEVPVYTGQSNLEVWAANVFDGRPFPGSRRGLDTDHPRSSPRPSWSVPLYSAPNLPEMQAVFDQLNHTIGVGSPADPAAIEVFVRSATEKVSRYPEMSVRDPQLLRLAVPVVGPPSAAGADPFAFDIVRAGNLITNATGREPQAAENHLCDALRVLKVHETAPTSATAQVSPRAAYFHALVSYLGAVARARLGDYTGARESVRVAAQWIARTDGWSPGNPANAVASLGDRIRVLGALTGAGSSGPLPSAESHDAAWIGFAVSRFGARGEFTGGSPRWAGIKQALRELRGLYLRARPPVLWPSPVL